MKHWLFFPAFFLFFGLNAVAQIASPNTSNQTKVFKADAYGSYAFVGSTVKLGKTAPVGTGSSCGTTLIGMNRTGTVASVTASPTLTSGTIDTAASDTATSSLSSSAVAEVNLLGGLIRGDAVKAVSMTNHDSAGFHVSASGSRLVNLVVAGQVFTAVPAPNTTIQLSGIGKVVLNEQISSASAASANLTVNMIHVYVTVANNLNIAAGTQIIVAHANSGMMNVEGPAILDGFSYGSTVKVGSLLRSTQTAPESVPCAGTGGAVKTASIMGANVSGALQSGTVSNTAMGNVMPSSSTSETTSEVQGLNLLSSLVTADVIKTKAHANVASGGAFQFSEASSFVNLRVQGHAEINANVAANTQVAIAGVGTLYLHRVLKSANAIEVRMIELVVNQNNSLGLPIGTDIKIAVAEASLHSNSQP